MLFLCNIQAVAGIGEPNILPVSTVNGAGLAVVLGFESASRISGKH